MLLALLLACPPSAPGPAPSGTPSAALSIRAGEVAKRARDVAARAEDLEGKFDELRAAPEAERAERVAWVRAEAKAIHELSVEIEAEVRAIEASAQVY